MTRTDPRLAAAVQLKAVLDGRSLSDQKAGSDNPALTQALTYGCLRFLGQLDLLLASLLQRPLKARDSDLHCLLLVAIYALGWQATPAHATINQSVEGARALGKAWAAKLINAVLRNYQRQGCPRQPASASPDQLTNHPDWLVQALTAAWPDQIAAVLENNNQQAPMFLRVNLRKGSRDSYLEQLADHQISARAAGWTAACVRMDRPLPVADIPGFSEGLVSVQDAAAQLAAELLAPTGQERILDACAAPGGKTGHLLEIAPDCHLTAVESDPARSRLIGDNLKRLQLDCDICTADAAALDAQPFDGILLDAPCSATGVIRRHPDIKWLRRATDIQPLAQSQGRLLDHLWTLLKPGGRLLYATCSLLPAENSSTIEAFMARRPEAVATSMPLEVGMDARPGRQILPGDRDADGFYYALLQKPAR